jgi:ATP-dependent exoDNAse (exonuclease V) alpha subunit
MRMLTDPYLNALRLKYGYAITCHKAQGGEWPEVFAVFEKSLFHPNNASWMYRWIYTAITRSSEKLHLLENILIR